MASLVMASHRNLSDFFVELFKVNKLETSQRAMERRMLNVKLKDRISNIIIGQRTRVTDIVQSLTNMKWKWAAGWTHRPNEK